MSTGLRALVEKVPGLQQRYPDEWRFDCCPVNPAHSAYYQPSQDALWCDGPCTEAGLRAGVTAWAETVDREVNAPPVCAAASSNLYGHDSLACVDCMVRRTWAREEAARRADARSARGQPLPESVNLADLLAEPEEDTPFLVEGLWPLGAHVLLSAKAKAGKSTVRNNAIRSLVDGDPFLGCFDVPHPVQRVVVLDLELTRSMNRRWLRRQGIANTGAVDVIPMRGQAHTLDMGGWKDRWVERARGYDVAVLDCLEPVLHALGLNPNTEARKFLEDWTAMCTAAEVPSSLVLHHHGHGAERAKGDSGIMGWADAMWDLVCEDPDDITKPRYFKAFGREVDVPEGALDYAHETGHLRYVGGTSRAVGKGVRQTREGLDTLLRALLADHDRRVRAGEPAPTDRCSLPWGSKGAVESIARAAGLTRDPARQAIEVAQGQGLLVASRGKGASHAQVFALSPPGMARAREVL